MRNTNCNYGRKIISLAKKRQEIKEDSDIELLALTFHNLYLGLSYQGALIDKLSIARTGGVMGLYLLKTHNVNKIKTS